MSTDSFQRAFTLLQITEGGYANNPKDPGGATMKGVTHRTYDDYRHLHGLPTQDVRKITDAEVEGIYKGQYWDTVRADALPSGVAYCVFDAAVNSGPSQAAKWLQEVVGAQIDGVVGTETASAARKMPAADLINRYCDMRLAFMRRLKTWAEFKVGWARRVSEVRKQSLTWAASAPVRKTVIPAQPKATGPNTVAAGVSDMLANPAPLGAVAGLLGSAGALTSGDGPVQYAIAGLLIVGALVGIWWVVRRASK